MSDSFFGQWLEQKMKDAQMSDTRLAAHLGITAPAVAKWRAGMNTPRDERHLDGIAEALKVSRTEVYKMAGRWVPGLEHEDLNPAIAKLAYDIQEQLRQIEDPEVRELAEEELKAHLGKWIDGIERINEFLDKLMPSRSR